jgi:hypothetical protein
MIFLPLVHTEEIISLMQVVGCSRDQCGSRLLPWPRGLAVFREIFGRSCEITVE